MKLIVACLLAASLLLALPQTSHADQFTQIQGNPNTYWVPAAAADPKDIVSKPSPGSAAPPAPPYYAAGPGPYAYPPPGYVAGPAPYYYGPPPGYYGPRPVYYGPPPVAVGYYGGPHGSRVVIGLPGLFFGFHVH